MKPWYCNTGDYIRPLTEAQFRKNIKELFDRYNASSVEAKLDTMPKQAYDAIMGY